MSKSELDQCWKNMLLDFLSEFFSERIASLKQLYQRITECVDALQKSQPNLPIAIIIYPDYDSAHVTLALPEELTLFIEKYLEGYYYSSGHAADYFFVVVPLPGHACTEYAAYTKMCEENARFELNIYSDLNFSLERDVYKRKYYLEDGERICVQSFDPKFYKFNNIFGQTFEFEDEEGYKEIEVHGRMVVIPPVSWEGFLGRLYEMIGRERLPEEDFESATNRLSGFGVWSKDDFLMMLGDDLSEDISDIRGRMEDSLDDVYRFVFCRTGTVLDSLDRLVMALPNGSIKCFHGAAIKDEDRYCFLTIDDILDFNRYPDGLVSFSSYYDKKSGKFLSRNLKSRFERFLELLPEIAEIAEECTDDDWSPEGDGQRLCERYELAFPIWFPNLDRWFLGCYISSLQDSVFSTKYLGSDDGLLFGAKCIVFPAFEEVNWRPHLEQLRLQLAGQGELDFGIS